MNKSKKRTILERIKAFKFSLFKVKWNDVYFALNIIEISTLSKHYNFHDLRSRSLFSIFRYHEIWNKNITTFKKIIPYKINLFSRINIFYFEFNFGY